jgi:hypothetical protein
MPATFPRLALLIAVTAAAVPALMAQQNPSSTDLKYQLPPEVMVKLVDAPPTPTISLSPAHGAAPHPH